MMNSFHVTVAESDVVLAPMPALQFRQALLTQSDSLGKHSKLKTEFGTAGDKFSKPRDEICVGNGEHITRRDDLGFSHHAAKPG